MNINATIPKTSPKDIYNQEDLYSSMDVVFAPADGDPARIITTGTSELIVITPRGIEIQSYDQLNWEAFIKVEEDVSIVFSAAKKVK